MLEAEDGRRGFELACAELPDIVLSDVKMPTLDGFGLVEALRRNARTRTIPVVFLSGEQTPAARTRAYALGVSGFVAKPFDPVAIPALLLGVLDRGASRLEAAAG